MINLRYYLGALISIPLLPVLYVQGIQIRKKVPKLPEATGTEGRCIVETNQKKPLQIISLGESTVAGVGVKTHEEGFTGTFARELSNQIGVTIEWRVYAKSGYTAKQVRALLIPKIEEKNPDLILVGLGGNDAFTLNHPKRWRKHIKQLIVDLRKQFPETLIAFTNMPPIKEFPAFTPLIKFVIGNLVEILGHELKSLVENFDRVIYFDDKITLKEWQERLNIDGEPSDFFSDGVHPSKLTYQTWAKDLAQRVSQLENNFRTNNHDKSFIENEQKLKIFLEDLIQSNWSSFNELSFAEQSRRTSQIMRDFKEVLLEVSSSDFDKIQDILDSFSAAYDEPEIMGKSKHFFYHYCGRTNGGHALLMNFGGMIKQVEYERAIENSTEKCDCSVAEKFGKAPNFENMNKIGWVNDSYYFPHVYECKVCGTYWTSFVNDDDLGHTVWEKYSSEDDDHLILD